MSLGKKYTPTEAAKKAIRDSLFKLGYVADQMFEEQFPDATERERSLVNAAMDKRFDRIQKIVAAKKPKK